MDHNGFVISMFNTEEIAARYKHAGFCQGIKSIIQIADDLGSERAIEEARKYYNAHEGEDDESLIVIDATYPEEGDN
jgi:hypothetical protein|nr:MAG TPA: hypothetical protein [Caudoviricetes sp.]